VEQILLYIVTISGFSGFMLGLYSLLLPALQRRGLRLPFAAGPSDEEDDILEDEYDEPDPGVDDSTATSFKTRRASLLDRLPKRRVQEDETDLEDADIDDELLGALDLTKERTEIAAEDAEEYDSDDDDDLRELTAAAGVDPLLAALEDETGDEDDEAGDEDDEAGDEDDEAGDEDDEAGDDEAGENEDEDDEDEEAEQPEQPAIHIVSGGGGEDMLALFNEGSNVEKIVEAWRAGLPDPTIEELLAEARAISEMIHGKRPTA